VSRDCARTQITGIADGIGLATAKMLANHGATVLAVDISGTLLEANLARVKGIEPFIINLGETCAGEAIAMETKRRFKNLDFLVNNAGICPVASLEEQATSV
tara:strand:+ start:48 stop:353 length:306 start_codon:yes stop_codon:yes gene_type:complete